MDEYDDHNFVPPGDPDDDMMLCQWGKGTDSVCLDGADSQNHRNDPDVITTPLEEILADDGYDFVGPVVQQCDECGGWGNKHYLSCSVWDGIVSRPRLGDPNVEEVLDADEEMALSGRSAHLRDHSPKNKVKGCIDCENMVWL